YPTYFFTKSLHFSSTNQGREKLENEKDNDVRARWEFVQAYINFVVYSHHLYARVKQEQSDGEKHEHQCA
ncbi:MAG: hypothetical protein ACXW1F_04360, partial [Halobacteriota archaeon]